MLIFCVSDPLYFVATNQSQYIVKGKDSLVHCNARGESAPFITWYKELNNRDSIRVSKIYFVELKKAVFMKERLLTLSCLLLVDLVLRIVPKNLRLVSDVIQKLYLYLTVTKR